MHDTSTAAARPVTPRVRRRAWADPAVRTWWLLAAVVALAVLAFVGAELWSRRTEARLIRDGVPERAILIGSATKRLPGQVIVADQEQVVVQFPWHGKDERPVGNLTRNAAVGEIIPIHVNSDDPTDWTDRVEPSPIVTKVLVGLLLVPVPPVLLLIGWLLQRRVVRAYATGAAAVATVAGRGQTPVAPLSYAVRCSVRGAEDRTVHTVFVPKRAVAKPPAKGDAVDVIVPPGGGRPVAAAWFEG